MKKILLSALPVLCALLMTACDDDNATANYSVPLDEAVGSYTGDKLQINVGGQSVLLLSGETAQISGSDANQLTISIPDYAVPGETGLTFTDVKMTTPLFNVFEGTSSNASRDITLSGELRDGRLTLNLTPTYKSDIIGVWNLNLETDDFGTATLTPISIETEQDISGSQFIVQILGALLKGSMAVVNIDFQADGNLTATYNSNLLNDMMPALSGEQISPVFVHSPLNAIKWYVKDGALYLQDEEGQYWRSFVFIENAVTFQTVSKPEHFYYSACAFGKFQRLLANYPAETLHEVIPHFHDTADRYKNFEKAVAENASGGTPATWVGCPVSSSWNCPGAAHTSALSSAA